MAGLHFAFIAFMLFGGLPALWRWWLVFLHVPAFVWGILTSSATGAVP